MPLSYSDHRQNYVDIESASYRTDKQKFVSDLFECGAIAVSNMVDLNQYNMREERYLQIIRNCKLPDQSMLKKYFAKIYAQLNSVIYDDEKFNDNLGELFMRCDLGNKNTGQFFTPYHISEFMARATLEESLIKEKAEKDDILMARYFFVIHKSFFITFSPFLLFYYFYDNVFNESLCIMSAIAANTITGRFDR